MPKRLTDAGHEIWKIMEDNCPLDLNNLVEDIAGKLIGQLKDDEMNAYDIEYRSEDFTTHYGDGNCLEDYQYTPETVKFYKDLAYSKGSDEGISFLTDIVAIKVRDLVLKKLNIAEPPHVFKEFNNPGKTLS